MARLEGTASMLSKQSPLLASLFQRDGPFRGYCKIASWQTQIYLDPSFRGMARLEGTARYTYPADTLHFRGFRGMARLESTASKIYEHSTGPGTQVSEGWPVYRVLQVLACNDADITGLCFRGM